MSSRTTHSTPVGYVAWIFGFIGVVAGQRVDEQVEQLELGTDSELTEHISLVDHDRARRDFQFPSN